MGHDHHDHLALNATRHALHVALFLNFGMFIIEMWQGISGESSALIADSMDFFADSFSYLLTLYVLEKSLRMRAHASLLKAGMMLVLAAIVLVQGFHNLLAGNTPAYITMGWVSLLALAANVTSAAMLYRSRNRDSNMESVWLCSRNDAINNVGILIAAGLVYLTHSPLPDLIVALFIAWLSASSALKVIADAKKELHHDH